MHKIDDIQNLHDSDSGLDTTSIGTISFAEWQSYKTYISFY